MAKRPIRRFTKQTNDLADFARAMSHPARIAIVRMLLTENAATCGEIVDALPLAQPTVSQHLRSLERSGLIIPKPDGTRVCYQLDRTRIAAFCHAFSETLGNNRRSAPGRARSRTLT